MSTLPTNLRRQLENVVMQARTIAEGGARKALDALAVHEPDPYRHMDEGQRDLRRKLRAQAKQLGDGENQIKRGAYEIKHLVEKLAYDQWHRILFARFLLENNLLISPEHQVSVTLDDCEDLAPSLGLKGAWAVAAHFAAKELPEIFRADDPAGAVELPLEDRGPLINFVMGLRVEVFTASDSLGWCYQFWQAARKDEINAAGNPIGADELPAVTQLFTEDYMVDFLLDNALGAWHAGRVLATNPTLAETAQSEEELRKAVALPGCPWKYLRFVRRKDGKLKPAAGMFDGWPKAAKELKCLDPCMGSGHFLVALFERLVALRIAEENLDEAAAVAAVIHDNLFGLEIDPRCTQIGAFNLALAAWRRVGHSKLPAMNLACSGLAPNTREANWLAVAGNNEKLRRSMGRLYRLFKYSPLLGSLINPRTGTGDLLEAAFHELQPLLEEALAQDTKDDVAHEMAVTARGLAKAAEILAGQFTLVVTNVPYLGSGDQTDILKSFLEETYPDSKTDLATAFLERCLEQVCDRGALALVVPRIWLTFTAYYGKLRRKLLSRYQWNALAPLGKRAFRTIRGEIVDVALIQLTKHSAKSSDFAFLDVSESKGPDRKEAALTEAEIIIRSQGLCLSNPGYVPLVDGAVTKSRDSQLLRSFVSVYEGISRGDIGRFDRCFWEIPDLNVRRWRPLIGSSTKQGAYGGASRIFLWEDGHGELSRSASARVQGTEAWSKPGVFVSRTHMNAHLTNGAAHSQNGVAIVPNNREDLAAIWCFCSSEQYKKAVLKLNQKLIKPTGVMDQVSFDASAWRRSASKVYKRGLLKPYSPDPTQWFFNGHPKGSDQPLHVAVARLLGYRWPRQSGSSFPDCPALGPDRIEKVADTNGIVSLSATKGEAPAAERLRGLLVQALGNSDLSALIAAAGPKGSKSETLEDWLRDEFFEQHCALFHHRPFIWHIWDGHKSGFSVLVNYHQLTHANLEKLTYAYLGDWIRRQKAAVEAEKGGADARLQAAKRLQTRLKLILDGDPPFDIFVRWKPLAEQPIGWTPDLEDGVRVNIRPFMEAAAGNSRVPPLLRARPNLNWARDKGTAPVSSKQEFPWYWEWNEKRVDFQGGGKFDGNRWNSCHYSNALRRAARKAR
jgi:hypothetical protein